MSKSVVIILSVLLSIAAGATFLTDDTQIISSQTTTHTTRISSESGGSGESNLTNNMASSAHINTTQNHSSNSEHYSNDGNLSGLDSFNRTKQTSQRESQKTITSSATATQRSSQNDYITAELEEKLMSRSFLQAAYRQAIDESSNSAVPIRQELQQLDQEIEQAQQQLAENNGCDPAIFDCTPSNDGGINNDKENRDNKSADEPIDNDNEKSECYRSANKEICYACMRDPFNKICPPIRPAHCNNRPAYVPGVYRCPCPEDSDWRNDWFRFFNPELLRERGCTIPTAPSN